MDKLKNMLDKIGTWSPEELEKELQTWSTEDIRQMWTRVKPTFRRMCRVFGLMPPSRRVSSRGIRLHQQIKRFDVIQRFAEAD